jgi:hypothetical protein
MFQAIGKFLRIVTLIIPLIEGIIKIIKEEKK